MMTLAHVPYRGKVIYKDIVILHYQVSMLAMCLMFYTFYIATILSNITAYRRIDLMSSLQLSAHSRIDEKTHPTALCKYFNGGNYNLTQLLKKTTEIWRDSPDILLKSNWYN